MSGPAYTCQRHKSFTSAFQQLLPSDIVEPPKRIEGEVCEMLLMHEWRALQLAPRVEDL